MSGLGACVVGWFEEVLAPAGAVLLLLCVAGALEVEALRDEAPDSRSFGILIFNPVSEGGGLPLGVLSVSGWRFNLSFGSLILIGPGGIPASAGSFG